MEVEDGYPNYLVEKGTFFTRPEGIPLLMDLHNTEIPKDIIPFDKAKTCKNKRQYVHFYMYDQKFAKFLKRYKKFYTFKSFFKIFQYIFKIEIKSVKKPIMSIKY